MDAWQESSRNESSSAASAGPTTGPPFPASTWASRAQAQLYLRTPEGHAPHLCTIPCVYEAGGGTSVPLPELPADAGCATGSAHRPARARRALRARLGPAGSNRSGNGALIDGLRPAEPQKRRAGGGAAPSNRNLAWRHAWLTA